MERKADSITQEELKRYVDYNRDTGIFTWIAPKRKRTKNPIGGCLSDKGYIRLYINGCYINAQLMAWLYEYGTIPKTYLEHINGDKSDNRISNLRERTIKPHSEYMRKYKDSLGAKRTVDIITQEELKSYVNYNSDTGIFTWVQAKSGRRTTSVAGSKGHKGSINIWLRGIHIPAHTAAWVYVYGVHPSKNLKHINGDRSDNRISNLQEKQPKPRGTYLDESGEPSHLRYTVEDIDQEIVKHHLHYDPETGAFTRIAGIPCVINTTPGRKNSSGYVTISLKGVSYMAHRLAWLYTYGYLPESDVDIDHKNGVRDDNRICNLREATRVENMANRVLSRISSSGFRGVQQHYQEGKWVARCEINGYAYKLGIFDTPEEASEAYQTFTKKHHGEFHYTLRESVSTPVPCAV